MLELFINQLHEVKLQQRYFQQDDAICHRSPQSIADLRQFFDDCPMSLRCEPEETLKIMAAYKILGRFTYFD